MLEPSKKISKKFIIITSVFVAAVLLIFWLIVSGTAESVIHTTAVKISSWWYELQHPPVEMHPIDSLKPGKYLLQRDWGLDETDYVEVFDDFTLRYVGEYWINEKNKDLEQDPDYYNEPGFVDRTERIYYEMLYPSQCVGFSGAVGGFSYVDENTLIISRIRDEKDDVVDHDYSLNKSPERVDAYYIYAE